MCLSTYPIQRASNGLHIHEYSKTAFIINCMTQHLFGFNPLYYDLFWMSADTHNVSFICPPERVWLIVAPTINWHSWQPKLNYYTFLLLKHKYKKKDFKWSNDGFRNLQATHTEILRSRRHSTFIFKATEICKVLFCSIKYSWLN